MKQKRTSIKFYERNSERMFRNVFYSNQSGVCGVYGPTGSGKSFLFNEILKISIKNKVRILQLPMQEVLETKFLLHAFCQTLYRIIIPFVKELKNDYKINFDFKSLEKVLKIQFKNESDEIKNDYRKLLVDFLIFSDKIVKQFNIKIIFGYDDLSMLQKKDLLKVLQLARYVKNYIPSLNLYLFFDKEKIMSELGKSDFEDIKKEYFNNLVTVEESWNFYEIENKMIFNFIKKERISNIGLILFLLSENTLADRFITKGYENTFDIDSYLFLSSEIEFICFALNYFKETNHDTYSKIMNSVMSFHLIKDVPGYVTIEQRSSENKLTFQKLKSLIYFFETKETEYKGPNKYSYLASNMNFPYDYDWQIFFTTKYDQKRTREENINCYMPLILSFVDIKFLEKRDNGYWFIVDEDFMDEELKNFFLTVIEHQIYFTFVSVMERIFYYEELSRFILEYTKKAYKLKTK